MKEKKQPKNQPNTQTPQLDGSALSSNQAVCSVHQTCTTDRTWLIDTSEIQIHLQTNKWS